jgi:hypothetical protein
MAAGEGASGTAADFNQARVDFDTAWPALLPTRTEADFQEWRDQTAEKYRHSDRGGRTSPDARQPPANPRTSRAESRERAVPAWTHMLKYFQCQFAIVGLCLAALAGTSAALAQTATIPGEASTPPPKTTTIERSAKGPTAKAIQVGVYLNVQPDCTSGSLPALRLVASPANGTITIKRAKVTATNYKQCLALEVPGFVAFYQSKPDFAGTDVAIIEVKYPQGRTELQRITINVGTGPGGQKI